MRILIVGADGQLGWAMRQCIERGGGPMGRLPQAYDDVCADYADIGDFDIADAESVMRWFSGREPYDLVFNCAAYTDVDGCEREEPRALAVNALGPYHLARAARLQGATLVHVSTDYVFPGTDPKPQDEEAKPCPLSAYGRTKLAGELLASQTTEHLYAVRTAWLYGRHGKNFVDTMLRLARERGSISVVDDQLGSPTNADDLAYCILLLAVSGRYGTYHAVGAGVCSWFDLASAAVDLACIPCRKEPISSQEYRRRFPDSARRPAYSALDSTKLEATIGVRPRAWKEALADYVEGMALEPDGLCVEVGEANQATAASNCIVSGNFTFTKTGIEGVRIVDVRVFGDDRGYFAETYKKRDFIRGGIVCEFVQDNQSSSTRGVLRGLHFQIEHPQAKLLRVVKGEVYDVVVDIRAGSPTFGAWEGMVLSAKNHRQLFIPRGCAHGFLALTDEVEFVYKCDDVYHPDDEGGIRWNDPDIGIEWPPLAGDTSFDPGKLILSERDQNLPFLRDADVS